MPRTNISIADEVADRLSEEALKRNKTLYAFANESLDAVISVCRLSGNPSEVLASWKIGRMMKDVDAIPLPGDLVERLIKKLDETDREWLHRAWFTEGGRIGSYLRMGYPDLDQLSQAAVEFQGLLPFKRIEVKDQLSEKGMLVVRVLGAGISAEATACAEQFVRGIVDSYQWVVKGSRSVEGMMELEIQKKTR